MRFWSAFFLLSIGASAFGTEFPFSTPSADRWHYPFNFTAGSRATASCFGAAGIVGFNDRDGVVIVAWDTSAQIAPGQGADAYNLVSLRVTLTHQANQNINPSWLPDQTADEWFTYDVNGDGVVNADGIARGAPGDTDGESDDVDPGRAIELFGAGFGPTHDALTWTEASAYIGSDGNANVARDPFPFVFQESTLAVLHVEDTVDGLFNGAHGVSQFTPIPWAVGVSEGYVPGNQQVPFDVSFDIDLSLSDGAVKRYFQEQLNTGRIIVAITALTETVEQGPVAGIPSFYMKEGVPLDVGAKAAALLVTLDERPVPAASTWGLIVMALVCIVSGTIVLRRVPLARS